MMNRAPTRWEYALIFALTLAAGATVAGMIEEPGYTDAYYYYNAAHRLVGGEGLTDPYVALTYIGAQDRLPQPSHLYWMPLASLVAAAGMWLGGSTFKAAQAPFVVLWAALALVSFWCGARLGKTRRHAWVAGLLAICSGFFAPFWTSTDTFALYGVTGVLALAGMGLARARRDPRWMALSGAMAGLAHLTRADGMLLPAAILLVALWPDTSPPNPLSTRGEGASWRGRAKAAGVGLLTYALVMLPWVARNVSVGAPPLPTGGAVTIWLRDYAEIVNYPPDNLTLQRFLDWGAGNIIDSRWEALVTNVQHFVAEQGLVVLAPFIVIGMWRRRRAPFLTGVWVYAVGLHLAMTFAFAYPGMRGGLFHSSAALLPFWFSVGVLGIDDAVDWAAARRRSWRPAQAKLIFTAALVVIAALLTLSVLGARLPAWNEAGKRYATLDEMLPADARVMVNDPAAFYYHTGRPGVVVPNGRAEAVRALAERYGVTHVILDINRTPPLTDLYLGREQADFLSEVALLNGGDDDPANDVRVFRVDLR
jgi:hypothetical protein